MPNVKSSYLWVVELSFRFFNCVHICVCWEFNLFYHGHILLFKLRRQCLPFRVSVLCGSSSESVRLSTGIKLELGCSLSCLPICLASYWNHFFFFWPCSRWDLSTPPVLKPQPHAVEARSLNHWTASEVPEIWFSQSLELVYLGTLVKNHGLVLGSSVPSRLNLSRDTGTNSISVPWCWGRLMWLSW